jgi:hypothetical protein
VTIEMTAVWEAFLSLLPTKDALAPGLPRTGNTTTPHDDALQTARVEGERRATARERVEGRDISCPGGLLRHIRFSQAHGHQLYQQLLYQFSVVLPSTRYIRRRSSPGRRRGGDRPYHKPWGSSCRFKTGVAVESGVRVGDGQKERPAGIVKTVVKPMVVKL